MKHAECGECGDPLSLENGYKFIDSAAERGVFCLRCRPSDGKGYTLSDLQRMREDGQVERARYEMSLMELVGPDVYFAVKQSQERRENQQRAEAVRQRMLAALESLGVVFNEEP